MDIAFRLSSQKQADDEQYQYGNLQPDRPAKVALRFQHQVVHLDGEIAYSLSIVDAFDIGKAFIIDDLLGCGHRFHNQLCHQTHQIIVVGVSQVTLNLYVVLTPCLGPSLPRNTTLVCVLNLSVSST